MPPVRPEVEPALTRRANRLRNAAAATSGVLTTGASSAPVEPVSTPEIAASAPEAAASQAGPQAAEPQAAPTAAPLSRRALRLQHAREAALQEPAALQAPEVPQAPAEVQHVELPQSEVFARDHVVAPFLPAAPVHEHPASGEDAFARASSAFGFLPVADETVADVENEAEAPAEPATPGHVVPRGRRIRRRIAAVGATVGVMGVAGLIAVSMTVPASAIAAVQAGDASTRASLVAADSHSAKKVDKGEIQAYVAADAVQEESMARADDYSTVSLLDVAAEENIHFSDTVYSNDPDAAIQWPFMVGVAMSSGYGMRNGRMHEGIDLIPGNGATIQAIADGTVRIATESGGNYGVTVYIDHVIDGKLITSHYSHMQHGSLAVHQGEKVKVGQALGRVGTTGRSTGPHLHFELILDGKKIDPLPWLRENAGRYSY